MPAASPQCPRAAARVRQLRSLAERGPRLCCGAARLQQPALVRGQATAGGAELGMPSWPPPGTRPLHSGHSTSFK